MSTKPKTAKIDPALREEAQVKRLLGIPLTKRETAAILGCSDWYVRKVETRALAKIRAVLREEWE